MSELERDLLSALEQALAHIDDMEGPIIVKDDIRLTLRPVARQARESRPASSAAPVIAAERRYVEFLARLAEILGRAPYELDEALALEQVRGMVSKAEQAQALEDELEAKMSRLELAIEKARIILEKAE